MSKLAFDYSKWDNLDTDDSDAEEPKAPIQEDDTQQKGWRAHADPASPFAVPFALSAHRGQLWIAPQWRADAAATATSADPVWEPLHLRGANWAGWHESGCPVPRR